MHSLIGPEHAGSLAAFDHVVSLFARSYGCAPAVVSSAPGRVNLIGEHLDYNGGPALPFAIERRTWVAAGPGIGFALASTEPGHPPVRPTGEERRGDWSDYVMGVVRELGRVRPVPGARIAVASDVQPGAGLSSSAALTVASAAALAHLVGLDVPRDTLAEIAFRAEHDYVGVRCGRMDQTVVAHAEEGTALLLDTDTGASDTCPFPYRLWIVPTGVEHALADGKYNARRSECERALARCRERWPQLPALAALEPALLSEARAFLPAPLGRRTRHVVTETARVGQVRQALEAADLAEVGRLLVAGHASLRGDFESSVAEADALVEAAVESGAFGARLTGAGWGGSVILLVPEENEAEVVQRTVAAFAGRFGRTPTAWSTRAASGVRLDRVT
ncbi:MAG: galactokinase [Gemmatimonadales bacterium]